MCNVTYISFVKQYFKDNIAATTRTFQLLVDVFCVPLPKIANKHLCQRFMEFIILSELFQMGQLPLFTI